MNSVARERTWIRPQFQLGNRRYNSFQTCGCTGLALAFIQSAALVRYLHLSQFVLLGMTAVVVVTFLGFVMGTKVVTGEEQIIYYHNEIAATAMLALFLSATHQPFLPYLDIAIPGVGVSLACGRIGCLMVGCCYGRPWRCGVIYRDEHARAGFSAHLVGIRLVPVQAIESLAVLSIVVVGINILLRSAAPGSASAWYVVSYGIVRFCLEFLRGDAVRPYWLGFSEAQWTSLILMTCVVWAEHSRMLPFQFRHVVATVGVAVAMIVIAVFRYFGRTPTHLLLHPRYVREFSEAVDLASRFSTEQPNHSETSPTIYIAHTSLGIRISAGLVRCGTAVIRHYTLSSEMHPMTTKVAKCLAKLLLRLRHPDAPAEVVEGCQGVFHVFIQTASGDQAQGAENITTHGLVGRLHTLRPTP